MEKKAQRQRRARRTRAKIRELGVRRLCIHRTPRHIYAQIIESDGSQVLASASTLDSTLRQAGTYTGSVKAATLVGRAIAERALELGVTQVAFDRSGFKYHGRVKALADAARDVGLRI